MHIHALSFAPIGTPPRCERRAFLAGRKLLKVVLTAAAVLAGGWLARSAGAEPSPPPAVPASTAPAVPQGPLEDAAEPFVPKQPPGQADLDRREAMALFAAGRAHEQRQEYAQALRMYQRALRLDPKAADIAQSVIYLACYLRQDNVAVRYLKMTDVAGDDPELLHQLGVYALQREDFPEAAALLERARGREKDAQESSGTVALHMELGRLDHLLEKYPQAAGHFAHVMQAMDHPERFGLQEQDQKTLFARSRRGL